MNQSVIKAIKLLDFFTDQIPELILKEIAELSDLPKPTAYRLLASLEACGFLVKQKDSEHDSRFRLGLKLMELGFLVADQLELRKIARPWMEKLAEELNEVIHLVIVNEEVDEAIYIEKVDSKRALRLYTKIGKNSPLYLGSGPKLLLAHLEEKKQEKILAQSDLHYFTYQNPIAKQQLIDELNKIKKEGYSISEGEQDVDTIGISYPIYNHHQKVVAALGVSGLSSHFEGENLNYIKEHTKRVAMEISYELGYGGTS
jgi:IclR family transcriptional regulator, KDG regulon repressor